MMLKFEFNFKGFSH